MVSLSAYLGPAVDVARIVESAPTAAGVSARYRRPFAAAWYPDDGRPEPVRSVCPALVRDDDPALDVPRRFASECVVANVGPDPAFDGQPFVHGPLSFAWDGVLDRYVELFEPVLLGRLSTETRALTSSRTPAAALFMTWIEHLQGRTDADGMADALEQMVGSLQDLALSHGATASFAVVASNGQCLVTLRTGTDATLPALYTVVASEPGAGLPPTGRRVATEPTSAGAWTSLDAHSLTVFTLEDDVAGRDGGAPE